MGYAQLDNSFWINKKVTSLSDKAFRLYVRSISFSSANLTDGEITQDALRALGGSKQVATELVERGVWEPADDGWNIHDYHKHNTATTRVKSARKAANTRWNKDSTEPPHDATAYAPPNATASTSAVRPHDAKQNRTEQNRTEQNTEPMPFEFDPDLAKAATKLDELGIRLNEREGEMLKERLDRGVKVDWIIRAAEETAQKANHPGWGYLARCLDNWGSKGPPPAWNGAKQQDASRRGLSVDDPMYVGGMPDLALLYEPSDIAQ